MGENLPRITDRVGQAFGVEEKGRVLALMLFILLTKVRK